MVRSEIGVTDALLPSPSGRGAGGEGIAECEEISENECYKYPLPEAIKHYARSMRKNATDAEGFLWLLLRDRRFAGRKFRRQHPIDNFIVDFYCHELKLAIELDGEYHSEAQQMVRDKIREDTLFALGIKTLRFQNEEVLNESDTILNDIWQYCQHKHLKLYEKIRITNLMPS